MSTIPELIAKLSSDQAGVDEAAGSVESSRHDVGQLIAHFEELGAGDSAAAASLRHTEEQLEHVRHGLLGGMAKAIETARRLVEQSKGHPTTAPSVPVGDPRAVVGDAVTAPEPKPGPNSLRREHVDPDKDDSKRSALSRFNRGFVRNASDIDQQMKTVGDTVGKTGRYDPNKPDYSDPGTTIAGTAVPRPPPTEIRSAAGDIQLPDAFSAVTLVGVFAFEGLSRLVTRRGSKRGTG